MYYRLIMSAAFSIKLVPKGWESGINYTEKDWVQLKVRHYSRKTTFKHVAKQVLGTHCLSHRRLIAVFSTKTCSHAKHQTRKTQPCGMSSPWHYCCYAKYWLTLSLPLIQCTSEAFEAKKGVRKIITNKLHKDHIEWERKHDDKIWTRKIFNKMWNK